MRLHNECEMLFFREIPHEIFSKCNLMEFVCMHSLDDVKDHHDKGSSSCKHFTRLSNYRILAFTYIVQAGQSL